MYHYKKLNSMPYAQCSVRVYDDGDMDLISYVTPVILIRNGWLECTGTYSRTTIRHIGNFMREYNLGDYYLAKSLYLSGKKMNIHTGEIKGVLEP